MIADGWYINAAMAPSIDFQQLSVDQATSPEIDAYRTAVTSLVLQDVPFRNVTLLCDVFFGKPRPIVPREWTRRIFDAVHSLAYSGPRPTQRAVSERFIWHGLKKDFRKWCKQCHSCQAAKIQCHTKAPLSPLPVPTGRFLSLYVDLVRPLPPSEGMTYLFTVIDRFTRWPEAIPIPYATATSCVRALIRHWIARFGVPDDITSDRGAHCTVYFFIVKRIG